MNILKALEKKFNTVETIFDYEIYELGYTDSDIIDTLKENVFEEINIDESFGIKNKAYTLVQYSELFNLYTKVQGNDTTLLIKYYVGNNFEYGYLDGFCALNTLGLSTQVCGSYNIVSLRAIEEIEIRDSIFVYTIKLYNGSVEKGRFKENMYIKSFNSYKDYFDITVDEALRIISKDNNIDKNYVYRRLEK